MPEVAGSANPPAPQPRRPRVLVVVGTRPEAVKMASILEHLRRRSGEVETRLALTGQHTDLVDQILGAFRMVSSYDLGNPDYNLGIMQDGQDLYHVSHACLDGIRKVIRDFRPNVLLAQGDTATVFFATFVGFIEDVAVGHVEAGLRSHNKRAPFPEEMFRRLSDVLTDYYFAPTTAARKNLLAENVPPERIFVTGNTVVDALLQAVGRREVPENRELRGIVERGTPLILLTAHRRESFGEPIREIFRAVRDLAEMASEMEILYPVHPNPQVLEPARELLGGHPRIHLTEPLDYLDLVTSLARAKLILTDSGGIQEEAPSFGTPVLVLREVTERPEGVEAGVAQLVGTNRALILDRALSELSAAQSRAGAPPPNPYGDGRAGARIADIVVASLTGKPRETSDWSGA